MTNPLDPARLVYRITGADRIDFLQGLVSNDLARLKAGAVYTAFLSPQGKYLADFFLVGERLGHIQQDACINCAQMSRLRPQRSP